MGWNTTVVVLNDALGDIKNDPEFGKNLAEAISKLTLPPSHRSKYGVDVVAGCHANAATAIETHHADGTAVVAVGGNMGVNLGTVGPYGDEEYEVRVLKALAKLHGYTLRKKPEKKHG